MAVTITFHPPSVSAGEGSPPSPAYNLVQSDTVTISAIPDELFESFAIPSTAYFPLTDIEVVASHPGALNQYIDTARLLRDWAQAGFPPVWYVEHGGPLVPVSSPSGEEIEVEV